MMDIILAFILGIIFTKYAKTKTLYGIVTQKDYPEIIKEVRGIGLLLGLQLHGDQTKFIKELEKNKLLTIKAGENVIRILPPLNVRKQEIDLAIKIIRNTCNQESNL